MEAWGTILAPCLCEMVLKRQGGIMVASLDFPLPCQTVSAMGKRANPMVEGTLLDRTRLTNPQFVPRVKRACSVKQRQARITLRELPALGRVRAGRYSRLAV